MHVGVIHPIESYWLCFGPQDQSARSVRNARQAFAQLTEWLLFGQIDFDFIAESLLPDLCPAQASAPLTVGQCAYSIIIVPSLRTIRATTLERLEAFHAAGGQLIFAGEIPSLVDAVPSERAQWLAAKAHVHSLHGARDPGRGGGDARDECQTSQRRACDDCADTAAL